MHLKDNFKEAAKYIESLELDKASLSPILKRIRKSDFTAEKDFITELAKYGLTIEKGLYIPFWAGIITSLLE